MNRHYFRMFGALTLLLGPAFLLYTFDKLTVTRGLVLLTAVELVGFGLAYLRKWAALYFSIPLFCFGLQQAFVSIYDIAFPHNLLAMAYGLSLTLPLVLTIRLWRQLTWGRRFF
ncbi:MAG TPA: hypothetical protein VJ306_11665 [Pyrinomonadaceae bacterium]|jgi:hypothetical protein|nr:hypothetical protein [Pyrinomonadaceae bacterium]